MRDRFASVGWRLGLGFGGVLLLLMAVVAAAIVSLNSLGRDLSRMDAVGVKSSDLVAKLDVEFVRYRMRHYRLVLETTREGRGKLLSETRASQAQVKDLADKVASCPAALVYKTESEALKEAVYEYAKTDQAFEDAIAKDDLKTASLVMSRDLRPLAKSRVEPAMADIVDKVQALSTRTTRQAEKGRITAFWFLSLASLAAAAVAVVVAARTTQSIAKRSTAMLDAIQKVQKQAIEPVEQTLAMAADRDLTARAEVEIPSVKVGGNDEIGRVGEALADMASAAGVAGESLNRALESIQALMASTAERSLSVADSSGSIADVSRDSARVGADIKANMLSVSSAVEEMTATAFEIASGSEKLASSAQDSAELMDHLHEAMRRGMATVEEQKAGAEAAMDKASEGRAALGRVNTSLSSISEKVEETRHAIRSLGDQQDRIGEIVATIESIADQTNLLALNAAIEAARAGVHGRGFAVVADEVRKLAEEASKATKAISSRIQSVREGILSAVVGIDHSVAAVRAGEGEGTAASEAMEALSSSAEATVSLAQKGLDELEEVRSAAINLQEVVHQVAAISEESAAAAQQLNASSEEISASVEDVTAHTEAQAYDLSTVADRADALMVNADTLLEMISQFQLGRESDIRMQCAGFKKAHQNWVRRIDAMIHDGKAVDDRTLTDHHECALGRWYEGAGKTLMGHAPEWPKLEAPHARVHMRARDAVNAMQRRDKASAETALAELRKASDEVVAILTALEARRLSEVRFEDRKAA